MSFKVLSYTLCAHVIILNSAQIIPGVIEVVCCECKASNILVREIRRRTLIWNCKTVVGLLLVFQITLDEGSEGILVQSLTSFTHGLLLALGN